MQHIAWPQLHTQPEAKQQLQDMLDTQSVRSPLLFHGPEGVGKWTHASNFACQILNITPQQLEQHPDVRFLQPEGNAFLHSMTQIHGMIDDLSISPHKGSVKCYFILHAECMLPVHANALLKALEELPAYAQVFLLTHHIEQILPTIASRCYKIAYHPLSESALTEILKDQHRIDASELSRLTLLAEGSVTQALALHSETGQSLYSLLTEAIKAAYSEDILSCMQTCETIETQIKSLEEAALQKRHMMALFTAFDYWFRDLALLQHSTQEELLFHTTEIQSLRACLHLPSPDSVEIERSLERAKAAYALHSRPRHILEYLLFSIINSNTMG